MRLEYFPFAQARQDMYLLERHQMQGFSSPLGKYMLCATVQQQGQHGQHLGDKDWEHFPQPLCVPGPLLTLLVGSGQTDVVGL